jgi:hypothetical protein
MNLFFPSNQSYYDDVECVGDSNMDKIERQSPQSQISCDVLQANFCDQPSP